jgi:hypothetical protein
MLLKMKLNRYIKINKAHLQKVIEAKQAIEDRLNSQSITITSTFKLPK